MHADERHQHGDDEADAQPGGKSGDRADRHQAMQRDGDNGRQQYRYDIGERGGVGEGKRPEPPRPSRALKRAR